MEPEHGLIGNADVQVCKRHCARRCAIAIDAERRAAVIEIGIISGIAPDRSAHVRRDDDNRCGRDSKRRSDDSQQFAHDYLCSQPQIPQHFHQTIARGYAPIWDFMFAIAAAIAAVWLPSEVVKTSNIFMSVKFDWAASKNTADKSVVFPLEMDISVPPLTLQ